MSASQELIDLTYENPAIMGSNPFLRGLQGEGPVIRVRTPAGDEAWLITRHAEIRKLLLDRRIGRSHPDPAHAPRYHQNPMLDMMRGGSDFATEPDVHAGLRMLLTPHFSGRNMDALQPKLAPMVLEAVAQFAAQEPPVDIHSQFSTRLTAQVIGELLGVPREDQPGLPAFVHQLAALADVQGAESGRDTLFGYMHELAASKRAEPADDVLSGIVRNGCTDEQAAMIGIMLVFAGLGSTSTHTTLGVARIGSDLALRDRLIADPGLMKSAVDEFLRASSDSGPIFPHYAREDIELADVTIRAGDLVLLNYGLANFDERAFPAPDEVDITRSPNPHLSFAYGMWHCAGAPLARMHLTMTFNALLAALPTLRLARPLADAGRSPDFLGGGLAEMLVTW